MKYLLDTNTCIRYLNGRSENVVRKMNDTLADDIVLCSIVKFELLFGAYKSNATSKNLAQQRIFFAKFSSLDFDDSSAEVCGQIRAFLEQKGKKIGVYDVQIAAIALQHQLILVTHNVTEFSRVPNLKLEDWEV